MVLSSYSSAMIIAGGSGISFALAAAEELMQQAVRRTSRVRFIELVWVVQSQGVFRARFPY
jgi:ATP-dependent protease HslVU (ClpYQ) peptidase subunit